MIISLFWSSDTKRWLWIPVREEEVAFGFFSDLAIAFESNARLWYSVTFETLTGYNRHWREVQSKCYQNGRGLGGHSYWRRGHRRRRVRSRNGVGLRSVQTISWLSVRNAKISTIRSATNHHPLIRTCLTPDLSGIASNVRRQWGLRLNQLKTNPVSTISSFPSKDGSIPVIKTPIKGDNVSDPRLIPFNRELKVPNPSFQSSASSSSSAKPIGLAALANISLSGSVTNTTVTNNKSKNGNNNTVSTSSASSVPITSNVSLMASAGKWLQNLN